MFLRLPAILIFMISLLTLLIGCVTGPPPKDYASFRSADPTSILVLPVVNRTIEVDAPDYFLCTVTRPIAERGYYVFPVNLVKRILEDDGLGDANLVHAADPTRLGELFQADAILYISIEKWTAKYAVFSTSVIVEFEYVLRSGVTGDELWRDRRTMTYQSGGGNTGNPLGDLISMAVSAAVTKAKPNYLPLAQQANVLALWTVHQGLPAGPYRDEYGIDTKDF